MCGPGWGGLHDAAKVRPPKLLVMISATGLKKGILSEEEYSVAAKANSADDPLRLGHDIRTCSYFLGLLT